MNNKTEKQEALSIMAHRLCRIGGGDSSLRSGRLAAILRSQNLLENIVHPENVVAEAERLLDVSAGGRLDDGAHPTILIQGETQNEIGAFECTDLFLAEEPKIRKAGLDQLERAISQYSILKNSIESVTRLFSDRNSTHPEYWSKAIICYDILKSDPFWRILKIRQLAQHRATQAAISEIVDLLVNIPDREDLINLYSNPTILFSLEDGVVCLEEYTYKTWSDFLGTKNENNNSFREPYPKDAWGFLHVFEKCNDINIGADILVSISKEEEHNAYYQLLVAQIITRDLENRYSVSESDRITKVAWIVSRILLNTLSSIEEFSLNAIKSELEDLHEQKQFLSMLWGRPHESDLNRCLTLGFKRPWTLATLFLAINKKGLLRAAITKAPEFVAVVSETLRSACIMELRWPLKALSTELPSSIGKLTELIGIELEIKELEEFGIEAQQVANLYNKSENLPTLLSETEPGDSTRLILLTNFLSGMYSKNPDAIRASLEVVTKGDWLKNQLSALDEQHWLSILEPLIESMADPNIDSNRKFSWTLCRTALDIKSSEEGLAAIVTAAIFAAVREEASNVTGILTSKEARKVVRARSQACLRSMNELYEHAPETIRARLRSHLQYLGWSGR